MSPNNKKKLNLIRIKLDKLDNSLLALIKKRTLLVNEVVKLKEFKKEIIDKERINSILKKIKGTPPQRAKRLLTPPRSMRVHSNPFCDNNSSNNVIAPPSSGVTDGHLIRFAVNSNASIFFISVSIQKT